MSKKIDLDAEVNAERPKAKNPKTGLLLAVGLFAVAGFLLYRAFFSGSSTPRVTELEQDTRQNLRIWLMVIDDYRFANRGRFPQLDDLRQVEIRSTDIEVAPVTVFDEYSQSPHDAENALELDYAVHAPPAHAGMTPSEFMIAVVVDLAAAQADPPVLAVGLASGSSLYVEKPAAIASVLEVPENEWLIEATGLSPDDLR
ncbi:MAG: hypothetical protein AAGB34_06395 [Planctomycetota bacterium]